MRRSFLYHTNRGSSLFGINNYWGDYPYYYHRHHCYENVFGSIAGAFVASGIITAAEMISEKKKKEKDVKRIEDINRNECKNINSADYKPRNMSSEFLNEKTSNNHKAIFNNELLSEHEFEKIVSEVEYKNEHILLKSIIPPVITGTVLPFRSAAYDFELDFNDLGKISGEYWIYTSAVKIDELLKFANAIKNAIKEKIGANKKNNLELGNNINMALFNSQRNIQVNNDKKKYTNNMNTFDTANNYQYILKNNIEFGNSDYRSLNTINDSCEIMPGERIDLSEYLYKEIKIVLMYDECSGDMDIDGCAFLLNQQEKVNIDEDMIFFNYEKSCDGAVFLVDFYSFPCIAVDLYKVSNEYSKIDICFAIYDDMSGFGSLKRPIIKGFAEEKEIFNMRLDGLSSEKSITGVQFYRNNDRWKMKMVCAGYNGKIEYLCKKYGVTIE